MLPTPLDRLHTLIQNHSSNPESWHSANFASYSPRSYREALAFVVQESTDEDVAETILNLAWKLWELYEQMPAERPATVAEPIWRPARLTLNDEVGWDGFTNQFHWNGWNLAAFDICTTVLILDSGQITNQDGQPVVWEYHSATDTFVIRDYGNDDTPLGVVGQSIVVDGVSHHVYPLGSGEWIWSELFSKE